MILAAISFAALLQHPRLEPKVTCHHGAVSYKFTGAPGTRFLYAGEEYTVPPRGWIELVNDSDGAPQYVARGRELPLDVWPIDAFGTRTVPLPQPQPTSKEGLHDTDSSVR